MPNPFPSLPYYHLQLAVDGDVDGPVVGGPPRHGLPPRVAVHTEVPPALLVVLEGEVAAPDLPRGAGAPRHRVLQQDQEDLLVQLLRSGHLGVTG